MKVSKKVYNYFLKENPKTYEIFKNYERYINKKSDELNAGKCELNKEEIDYIRATFDDILREFKSVYIKSLKDSKTKIYNMNFFNEMANIEFYKARRYQKELSIMILDIDFFRIVNEKYGHIQADKILRELAKTLGRNIRKVDILARFGGEEFIFLIRGGKHASKIIVNRIQKGIEENRMLKKHGITVSGGVSYLKKEDENINVIKKRADKLLYKAKNDGRNKILLDE